MVTPEQCLGVTKSVVLKCNQQVECLWNASPTIFDLQAATLVVCELWASIQQLRAVN